MLLLIKAGALRESMDQDKILSEGRCWWFMMRVLRNLGVTKSDRESRCTFDVTLLPSKRHIFFFLIQNVDIILFFVFPFYGKGDVGNMCHYCYFCPKFFILL